MGRSMLRPYKNRDKRKKKTDREERRGQEKSKPKTQVKNRYLGHPNPGNRPEGRPLQTQERSGRRLVGEAAVFFVGGEIANAEDGGIDGVALIDLL